MSLASGTRLGPYEVVAPLGSGGMGEVYRGRDTRLGRDVAIKVLPITFTADPERLRRFEQEARAASALNHPNILTVFDIGTDAGAPFVVTELLEGETLRDRIGGVGLPPRKAIEYAVPLAQGLAAAHERGIVHRDLKPENVFVTNDGRVKILDFGLAKLTEAQSAIAGLTTAPTIHPDTAPGVVLGTVGYMSPEQVRGQPTDHRCDIFAFGAILYEMLSGRRAFKGDSAVDTMSAILREEPPELSQTGRMLPPGLERIVRHCLEKSPDERFQSARDLAFDLQALSGDSGSTIQPVATRPRRRIGPIVAIVSALAIAAAIGAVVALRLTSVSSIHIQQLTFRRGLILHARFAPDDRTVVYGVTSRDDPYDVLLARADSAQSRSLGFPGADVLAVSPHGETALSLDRRFRGGFISTGTLARVPLAGGAPRPLLDDVQEADWAPDGEALAVIRDVEGRGTLEYPLGRPLYQTAGWISHARVSPQGDRVAFIDHPIRGDDGGVPAIVDTKGQVLRLATPFATIQGLAWSPAGEVWFTAASTGSRRELFATRPGRTARLVYNALGSLTLHDIGPDGSLLVTRDEVQLGLRVHQPGVNERDLSWLDWSSVADISRDGQTVLFNESGEGGGPNYSVYIRKADGSPAIRLGEGGGPVLSADAQWVACIRANRIVLLPTGVGQSRELSVDPVQYQRIRFFPDGRRLLVSANEAQHGVRLYVKNIDGVGLRPVTPEGVVTSTFEVSSDGRTIAVATADGSVSLYPVDGGPPRTIPGVKGGPSRWDVDGRALFVVSRGATNVTVERVTVETGQHETAIDLGPPSINGFQGVRITPDGRTYAYSYAVAQSTLFLVTGLK